MISILNLKRHLKIDLEQTDEDELLQAMEAAAVAIMQNETGRYFGPVTEITEILSANGWASIWLQGSPITDDEYLTFQLEQRATGGDWEAVGEADYEVDGYRIYPLVYWTPGLRTLRATYSAGYDEGAEPADVQQAVRELVAKMYEHRKPFAVGTTVAELPYSVQQIIRANRVTVV